MEKKKNKTSVVDHAASMEGRIAELEKLALALVRGGTVTSPDGVIDLGDPGLGASSNLFAYHY